MQREPLNGGRRPIIRAMDRALLRADRVLGDRFAEQVLKRHTMNASSRAWAWYVNGLAASPLLRGRERQAMYQRAGIDVETDWIGPGCYIHTSMLRVGANAKLNFGCHIENVAAVDIGERVGIGMGAMIITSDHEPGDSDQRHGEWVRREVSIGEGSWIGARATILPGVTIEKGCVVAAGAVVTEDCGADGLYGGVPARRIRDLPA